MGKSILDSLRQPEYTGENRCNPCTILNLGIGAVLSALLARKSKVAGLFVAIVSITVIYLRGYLVPGTPTMTKRYLPPTVLQWFGKGSEPVVASGLDPATESSPDEDPTGTSQADSDGGEPIAAEPNAEPLDLETYFLEHDVLEPCSDTDDLCLTETFEADWFAAIEPIADSDISASQVADAFGFEDDPETFELVVHGDTHRLRSEVAQVGRWPSRPALIADIAASRVFSSWVSDWDTYDPQAKGKLLNGLRMFLETCPTTGGDVEMSEDLVESCCRSQNVIAVTCEETGERLFEHRIDELDS